ncbi:MAG: polymer-forming cytoskeletal protein [Chloroherpetonaceae bacterium]|nr:polymer-forming cytoskeletal protein [Chloroherpetonaceae bacterium]
MFGKKNGTQNAIPTEKLSIVADGTLFRGDIETTGHLRIDGRVLGNIASTGNVAVGKGGNVEGNITALNLKISGRVKGNIDVAGRCVLDSTAILTGDSKTKILVVEEGATINGKITMELREPYTEELRQADFA